MTDVNQLITEHLDIWTSAIEKKSSAGRGNGGSASMYGIKKLRELILDLAVRGALLPQQTEDGDAQNLVMSLEEARSIRVAAGEFKAPKPSLPFDDEPEPTLPMNWARVRFGQLVRVINGRAYKKTELLSSGTPILRVGNLFTVKEWYYSDLELEPDKYIDDGDLIYAWSASFGPFIWQGGKVIYHYHIWKLEPFDDEHVSRAFLKLFLDQQTASIKASGHGIAMLHMTKDRMEQLEVRLPPLVEQHRIVTKVDELMALCDALEEQAQDSLKAHQKLVEACLATLTNSQSPEELGQNWARIETHFDTLLTTEESVLAARETIRQLGVRGLLTPQDGANEPADDLVAGLTKGRSSKKKRGRGAVGESKMIDPPFQLPEGWVWHRFGDLVEFQSELVKPNGFEDAFQIAPDIIEKGTGQLTDQRTVLEAGVRGPNNRFYEGQILYSKIRPSLSKAVIAPYDGLCSADMYPLKSLINTDYLLLAILSEDFLVQVRQLENRIKMPKLNIGSLSSIHIAVPPLAEQPRIVERVRRLQMLCDSLAKRMYTSSSLSANLADTLTTKIH